MTEQEVIQQANEVRKDILDRLDNLEAIKGEKYRIFTECSLGLMQMHALVMDLATPRTEHHHEALNEVLSKSCVEALVRISLLAGMDPKQVGEAMELAKGMNESTQANAQRIFLSSRSEHE